MNDSKRLTQEDIDLLFSENWLTSKQQSQFHIYEGYVKTRKEIEVFCPDQTVLNFIFNNDNSIEPIDIEYHVYLTSNGEFLTRIEKFSNVVEAIKLKEQLNNDNETTHYEIKVVYELCG